MKAKRFTQGLLLIAVAVILLASVTEAHANAWLPGHEGWAGDISLSTPAPGAKTESTESKTAAVSASTGGSGSFAMDVSVKTPLLAVLGSVAFIALALFGVFMVLDSQNRKKAAATTLAQPDYAGPTMPIAEPSRPKKLLLCGRGGYQDGRNYEIKDKITIGRSVDCTIPYPADYPGISRSHCTLIKRGDRMYLIDTSSTGTFLERTRSRLQPQSEVEVFVNDVFYLGEKKNMFRIEGR